MRSKERNTFNELLHSSRDKVEELEKTLYAKIVLTGGYMMLSGFRTRMATELMLFALDTASN